MELVKPSGFSQLEFAALVQNFVGDFDKAERFDMAELLDTVEHLDMASLDPEVLVEQASDKLAELQELVQSTLNFERSSTVLIAVEVKLR